MLDTKFFDGAQKKFAFMFYENDSKLFKFNVKVVGDIVEWQEILNGSLVEGVHRLTVRQDKVPNVAYRFYLIMMILAKSIQVIDLGRVQLILDSGFNDEKQELIDEKKREAMDQIARGLVEKQLDEKRIQRGRELEIMAPKK